MHMSNLQLAAIKRDKTSKGSLGRLRKEGMVPAIVYGLDKEPELVTVKAVDLRPHLSQRNHIIEIQVGGAGQKVMLKMIERDPIRKDLVHIDFLRVNDERPVVVNVPVTTHGMPFGVKTEGGVFSTMKKFVKLRAKVQDIPEIFDLDVSDLKSGVIFYVRDLKFEKGSFVTPGKTALFGVTSGRAEDEAAAAAAATATAAAAEKAAAAAATPAAGDKKDEKKDDKKK
jgi:large subunit ribosomal protein L25